MLDEQGKLSDEKISWFPVDILPNVCYYICDMRNDTTNSEDGIVRIYLIGTALALVIGTIVAVNLCSMFSDLAAKLDSVMTL